MNVASHTDSIRWRCIALIAKWTKLMSIYKPRRATILLCSAAVAVLATSAFAKPVHHRHREAQAPQMTAQPFTGADRDVRYPANMSGCTGRRKRRSWSPLCPPILGQRGGAGTVAREFSVWRPDQQFIGFRGAQIYRDQPYRTWQPLVRRFHGPCAQAHRTCRWR